MLYHNGRIIIVGDSYMPSAALYATSDDMGVTWSLKYLDIWGIRDIQFINDTLGYASGGLQGTLKTIDGGNTWSLMEIDDLGTGMYKNFENFHMVNDSVGYAISLSSIYKTTNGGGTPIIDVPVLYEYQSGVSENEFNVINVYPNPVKDELNIAGIETEIIDLIIYSIDGKLVYSQKNFENKQSINVSFLLAGNYVVTIKTEARVYSIQIFKE